MNKLFWAAIGIIAVAFIGLVVLGKDKEPAVADGAASAAVPVHGIGKQDATVKLVEYSDFECPACGLYYPVVEQVVEKYKDRISFEYRHYPLVSVHRHAFAAARASEAAANQGKFWEMYRLIFSNQQSWTRAKDAAPLFETYARQLQLDMRKYEADVANSRTNRAINASIAEFNARGLRRATPTFLLNDKQIQPRADVADFSKLIDGALSETGGA